MLQPRPVEPLDALCREQVAVGDESGDDAVLADGADYFIKIRVQQRLASADGDDGGSQTRQIIDTTEHFRGGNRGGVVVKFIAVGAGKITTPDGNNVDLD